MTDRPRSRPPRPARALLLPCAAACALALAACGGGSDDDGRTVATAPSTRAVPVDAERLDTGDMKQAAGTVSVCGPLQQMRLLGPAIRRFDGVSLRLQASTLGFPDGDGRPLRAFQERQRAESRDCDVYVARDAQEVLALAGDGGLYDLAPALEDWVAAPEADPLAPVLDGERAFGVPVRADRASGVLVLSVHGRNPGGALELARALADARTTDGS